jgi:hypothetical protein
LYFINLPFAGFYITPYLKLLYKRNDIQGHILSFNTDLRKPAESQIEWMDPQTLRVTALGLAYFTDPLTAELSFARGPGAEGARAETDEYTIVAERVEPGPLGGVGIRTLRYEFHEPLDTKPRFFFVFTKHGVQRLPLPVTRPQPELTPGPSAVHTKATKK